MNTKERILKAGCKLWPDVTYEAVGNMTGISRQAVQHHFPQGILKYTVAEYAIEKGQSKVIVQLMAAGHTAADKLSPAERIKHFNAI